MAALHAGKWGKLLVSKGYICKPRPSIGFKPAEQPPKGLDFDLWLGPSAVQPFHRNLVHYNWHWFWDFGNGEIGNQGVHQADVARWAIPGATLPTKVWSLGGRLGYKDQGQTPNMQMAVFEFGDVLLVLEVRGLVGELKLGKKSEKGPRDLAFAGFPSKVSNEFYTTEGMVRDGKFYPKPGGTVHPVAAKPRIGRRASSTTIPPAGPSAVSSPAFAAARRRPSPPPSSPATTRPPCATWPIFPTASAGRRRSARIRKA